MAKAKEKTYCVLYSDLKEESIKATRVQTTAKLLSFYHGNALVLAVPVSEIRRVCQTSFGSVKDFEWQVEESSKLEAFRAHLAQLREPRNGQIVN